MGRSGYAWIIFDSSCPTSTKKIVTWQGNWGPSNIHTASGISFCSLHDFFQGLERLDGICGLPYDGAAISKPTLKPYKQPSSTLGMVASVQDGDTSSCPYLEIHSESWIGAINLDEEHVKILRSLFKCPQCRTNNHTFPSCPLLKNWVIKKKVRSDTLPEGSTSETARSALVCIDDSC